MTQNRGYEGRLQAPSFGNDDFSPLKHSGDEGMEQDWLLQADDEKMEPLLLRCNQSQGHKGLFVVYS